MQLLPVSQYMQVLQRMDRQWVEVRVTLPPLLSAQLGAIVEYHWW